MRPGLPIEKSESSPREQVLPPVRPPKMAMGRSPSRPKVSRKKTALIGALGNATVAMAVEVNTIFRPNVQPSKNGRPRLRRLLLPRILDRLFPPFLWRTPRRMLTRCNIHLPPPWPGIIQFFIPAVTAWRFWTLGPRPIWCALTGCPIAMNY